MGWVLLAGSTLQQIDVTVRAQEFTAMNTPGIQAMTNIDLAARLPEGNDGYRHGGMPRLRVVTNKLPMSGTKDVQPWELTVKGVYGPGPQAVAVGRRGCSRATAR